MRGVVGCPTCGSLIFQADARRCAKCGQQLSPSAPPPAPAEPAALRARVVDAEAPDTPAREEWAYITGRVVAAEKPPQPEASPETLAQRWVQQAYEWMRKWPHAWMRQWRRSRQLAWMSALAALLFVTVLIGVLFAITQSARVPAATLHGYGDGNRLYSIGVPDGWHTAPAGSGAISTTVFADPHGSASLILQYAAPAEGSTISAARTYVDSFRDGTGDVTNAHGPETVSIAGEDWTRLAADEHNGTSPTVYRVVALAAIHGPYMVMIALVDVARDFDYANARYFQPMLRTLAFLR